jgi:hypothetical protein
MEQQQLAAVGPSGPTAARVACTTGCCGQLTLYLFFCTQMTAKMGERDSREEILKAFRLFDDDGSGTITLKVGL